MSQDTSAGPPTADEISTVARRIAAGAVAEVFAQLADADTDELLDVLGDLIEEYDSENPDPVSDVAGKLIDAVLAQRPGGADSGFEEPSSSGALVRYELVIETDDASEVDRLSDELERLACPLDHGDAGHDEPCRLPWFLTVAYLDDEDDETAGLRSLLNR